MIFTLLSARQLILFFCYISPHTPCTTPSLILSPNAKGHFWDDKWVNMIDGYWLRQTCWVWASWGSHGKYKQSSCSSSIQLCSHQNPIGFNIKNSHRESTHTKLQMHCTRTRAFDGHTDLHIFGLVSKCNLNCAILFYAPIIACTRWIRQLVRTLLYTNYTVKVIDNN